MHDETHEGPDGSAIHETPTPDPALEERVHEPLTTNGMGAEVPAVISQLRKDYAAARGDRQKTIPILPGRFNGMIAGSYRDVDPDELKRLNRRLQRAGGSGEAELTYAASLIALACDEVVMRPEPGKPYRPVGDTWTAVRGQKLVFEPRLAELLGFGGELTGTETASDIVRLVFSNERALEDHFLILDAWLKELLSGDEDDEDEAGERPT